MALPIAIHQARFATQNLRRRRWLQTALIGAGIPLALSRTGFTTLIAVCLVLLPSWPKRERRIAYVVGLGGVIACYFLVPGLLGTFRTLFTQTGSASRVSAFSQATPFIAQHPWLGQGVGTFLPQTYFFTDNQYLNSLISTGVIGLLALLALFATAWFTARSARHATDNPEARDLAQSLAASVIAAAVSFTTLDAFAFPIIAGLTFMLIGCIGATWRLVREEEAGKPLIEKGEQAPLRAIESVRVRQRNISRRN
jgi:O-antigen ligase